MRKSQSYKLFVAAAVRFRRLAREFAEAEKVLANAEAIYFDEGQATQRVCAPKGIVLQPGARRRENRYAPK